MRNLRYINAKKLTINAKQTLTKEVFKLNDIKAILRVHVNLRIYIQSQ